MPVGELLQRTSSRELAEWMAYAGLEPWGESRADLRMGILASLTANINRGKDQEPFKPSDFIPRFDESEAESEPEDESGGVPHWQQMLATVEMWNEALGGKDLRPGVAPGS